MERAMIRVLHVVIVSFFGKQYNNRGRWMPLLHLPLFVFFRLFVKCGRVFGKMAHIERIGYGVHKNIDVNL